MIGVAHLVTGLAVGGTEIALLRLLSRMDRSRFRNTVISLSGPGALAAPIRALGIEVYCLGLSAKRPNPLKLWQLIRLIRRIRPQVLQTWLYHSDLAGLAGAKLAGVDALAWNVRCSEMEERYRTGLGGLLVKMLARLSAIPDVVVINSQAGIRTHEAFGYHPRRWELIANGIDVDRFRPDPLARKSVRSELGIEPEAILVGLIARFDPIKCHKDFLQAAARLDQDTPVYFVLAGARVENENHELTSQIEALGLGGRALLLGPRSDVPRLHASLDIAVCSSAGEGFPNMIAEAMACGVPCVTTDVGDAAALVKDTGLVVPAHAPEAMADALSQLIGKGAPHRRDLGDAARRRIAEHFGLARMVARYESLYSELTDGAGLTKPSAEPA